MEYIVDVLNKIKWDVNVDSSEYTVVYRDRLDEKDVEIKYDTIERVEGNFIVIMRNDDEVFIPVHRIIQVKRNGKNIWKREQS